MKSKERPWALTKEGPIHEVKKGHEGSKSQKEGKKKKETIIIIIIKKKEEDLGQVRGHAGRISVSKIGIFFVTYCPSPWDLEWIVREKWFGR